MASRTILHYNSTERSVSVRSLPIQSSLTLCPGSSKFKRHTRRLTSLFQVLGRFLCAEMELKWQTASLCMKQCSLISEHSCAWQFAFNNNLSLSFQTPSKRGIVIYPVTLWMCCEFYKSSWAMAEHADDKTKDPCMKSLNYSQMFSFPFHVCGQLCLNSGY